MLTRQDIEIGFWRYFPDVFPDPSNIQDIEIFDIDRMRIDLSLMSPFIRDLSPSKRSKLIRLWQDTLPRLDNVRYLFLDHQISQVFFESICRMRNLEGLNIKWSKVKDLSPLQNMSTLKHLHFGSTPGIKTLRGLERASSLITLELEGFKNCTDISPIFTLENLELLRIISGGRVKAIKGIQKLSRLRSLTLGVSIADKDPTPIESLKNLEKLDVASTLWRKSEYTRLRNCFPKLSYGTFAKRLFRTKAAG